MSAIEYRYTGPDSRVWIEGRTYDARSWSQAEIRHWMAVYPKQVSSLFVPVQKNLLRSHGTMAEPADDTSTKAEKPKAQSASTKVDK